MPDARPDARDVHTLNVTPNAFRGTFLVKRQLTFFLASHYDLGSGRFDFPITAPSTTPLVQAASQSSLTELAHTTPAAWGCSNYGMGNTSPYRRITPDRDTNPPITRSTLTPNSVDCASNRWALPRGASIGNSVIIEKFTARYQGKRAYKDYYLERDYAGHGGSYWKLKHKTKQGWYSVRQNGSALSFRPCPGCKIITIDR